MNCTRIAIVSAVLVGSAVGACGGGEERLTKAALITSADAICQRAVDATTPLFESLFPTGEEMPPADTAAVPMGKAARILRQEYRDLASLRPPAADEDKYRAILVAYDRAVDDVELSAQRAASGDTNGYLEALGRGNETDAKSRAAMADYGFVTCAGD
jgi:hypothetical protein